MTAPEPAAVYRARAADFEAERARHEQAARRNGNLNVVLFFAAVAALAVGAVREEPLWYWLATALVLAFLTALARLRRVQEKAAQAAARQAINEEGLARLQRDWAGLPPPPAAPGGVPSDVPLAGGPPLGGLSIDPATAADLDLLGPGSLQHLLNTPATPAGQATLRAWLLQPAAPATVAARQAAADELAPLVEWREALAAHARQMGEAHTHYARFVAAAERPLWLAQQPLLVWAARLLPLLALLLGAAAWFRWPLLAGLPLYPVLGAVLLAILALALTAGNRASAIIGQIEAEQAVFGTYAALFDLLARQPLVAPALRELQARLGAEWGTQVIGARASPPAPPVRQAGTPALRAGDAMRSLERLMPLASIRRWMLFLPVELFTLWNIHLLWLLERWQARAGGNVRGWLLALGEFEALAAVATLHHDHPAWCFPTFAGVHRIEALGLAHPLLPPARAVGNDANMGPPGSFLLVTGSNMSGKSTLLRAIGINCVLAQMGAPVCAMGLRLPPVHVASSMRVQDSLREGVSYFLAELQSLKAIVDWAEGGQQPSSAPGERSGDGAPVLLYLLDEILQGTNSAERQIAARHVIQRLVASGAIGAVSTHDLALAAAPELAEAAAPVHFTESFTPGDPASGQAPAMHFDYTLRPGVATSTNALKLMEIVGLQ